MWLMGLGALSPVNASLTRSWLAGAISTKGCWAGWRCPYPSGHATNVVYRDSGVSRTCIDHVLVSPTLPCSGGTPALYPGLSTHLALLCDLDLPLLGMAPVNPTGRKFLHQLVVPETSHW